MSFTSSISSPLALGFFFGNNELTIKFYRNVMIISKNSATDITTSKQSTTSSAIKTVTVYFERQQLKNHLFNVNIDQGKSEEIINNFLTKRFPNIFAQVHLLKS